jgi:cell division protein FtsL
MPATATAPAVRPARGTGEHALVAGARVATAPAIRPPAAPGPAHQRPELRVVEPRRTLRTGPTFALGAVLAFAIAFAVVACQVALVQGQERLDQLDARIAESTGRYQQLRLEVAQLESPERIIATATADLGMVSPPAITYLTPDGAVTVPGAADPAVVPDHLAEHAETRPNLEGSG